MANVNAPFGFRPTCRTLQGAPGTAVPAHKLVGYGTAMFIHDVVTHAAAGTKASMCIDKAITPGTTPVLGVNMIWGAANTATDHIIMLAKDALFVVQGDGSGAVLLVAASMSKNANIVLTAGDTALLRSKHSLSETSLAVTAGLDLRVRGLFQSPSNVLGQYAQVYCSFNNLVDSDQKAGI